MIGSKLTGATSVAAGEDSVPTAGGICPPAPGLFIEDGASMPTGLLETVLTAGAAPPCSECGECASVAFTTGPYTAALSPAPGLLRTVVDLAPMDLSCLDPDADWTCNVSVTFTSPANWASFQWGYATIFVSAAAPAIGDESPPLPLAAIAGSPNVNIQLNDPGPAGATTVVPFTFTAFAGPSRPAPGLYSAKLVITSSTTRTTTVEEASLQICNDTSCAPGQTLFEHEDAAEHTVCSSCSPDPVDDVLVVEDVPSFAACTNFRMLITADVKWLGEPSPDVTAQLQAFLAEAGLDVATRAFSDFGTYNARMRMAQIPEDGAWHNDLVWESFSNPGQEYEDFAGPLPAQSIYFWPPVDMTHGEGTFAIRNLRVQIVTV